MIIRSNEKKGETMRIEIDTKHDTKEELKHVAAMLQAISGNADISFDYPQTGMSRLDRKLAKKKAKENLFDIHGATTEPEQSSAMPGFKNIFGDDPNPSEPVQSSPVQQSEPASQTGDLFSIFGSETANPQSSQVQSSVDPIMPSDEMMQSANQGSESMDIFNMLNSGQEKTENDKEESDVEQDVRLVPY